MESTHFSSPSSLWQVVDRLRVNDSPPSSGGTIENKPKIHTKSVTILFSAEFPCRVLRDRQLEYRRRRTDTGPCASVWFGRFSLDHFYEKWFCKMLLIPLQRYQAMCPVSTTWILTPSLTSISDPPPSCSLSWASSSFSNPPQSFAPASPAWKHLSWPFPRDSYSPGLGSVT